MTTTADLDEIIELKPDCVVYAAMSDEMDAAAVRDYVRFLKAGVNVVTTNTPGIMFPDRWIPELADQVRAAALVGGVTIYTSGIEPGFAGDQFAVILSTLSNTIRSVRAQEIFDYSAYPNQYLMFDAMGFGRPLDFTPLLELEGAQQFAWGPPIGLVARALGVELDRITEKYERVATPRDLHVACGLIPAGTCGAVRADTTGVVDGHPVITIEHINRMAPDLAPVGVGTTRHLPHRHRGRTAHPLRSSVRYRTDRAVSERQCHGGDGHARRQRHPVRRRGGSRHRDLTGPSNHRAAQRAGFRLNGEHRAARCAPDLVAPIDRKALAGHPLNSGPAR